MRIFSPGWPRTDLALQAEVREAMAGSVKFSATKERTFIAETERAALVELMVADILTNMVTYLNRPEFPEKLFARKYAGDPVKPAPRPGITGVCRMKIRDGDDDEGPADFSACFKELGKGRQDRAVAHVLFLTNSPDHIIFGTLVYRGSGVFQVFLVCIIRALSICQGLEMALAAFLIQRRNNESSDQ